MRYFLDAEFNGFRVGNLSHWRSFLKMKVQFRFKKH
jgi:hypothetical protein